MSVKVLLVMLKNCTFFYLLFPHNLKPQHIRCMFIYFSKTGIVEFTKEVEMWLDSHLCTKQQTIVASSCFLFNSSKDIK